MQIPSPSIGQRVGSKPPYTFWFVLKTHPFTILYTRINSSSWFGFRTRFFPLASQAPVSRKFVLPSVKVTGFGPLIWSAFGSSCPSSSQLQISQISYSCSAPKFAYPQQGHTIIPFFPISLISPLLSFLIPIGCFFVLALVRITCHSMASTGGSLGRYGQGWSVTGAAFAQAKDVTAGRSPLEWTCYAASAPMKWCGASWATKLKSQCRSQFHAARRD